MQATAQDIEGLILEAAAKVMADVAQKDRVALTSSSDLFGGKSPFDSMNLVSLIVDLEERLEAKFGKHVTLSDERAMSQKVNPFSKVSTLVDYVRLLLDEA